MSNTFCYKNPYENKLCNNIGEKVIQLETREALRHTDSKKTNYLYIKFPGGKKLLSI